MSDDEFKFPVRKLIALFIVLLLSVIIAKPYMESGHDKIIQYIQERRGNNIYQTTQSPNSVHFDPHDWYDNETIERSPYFRNDVKCVVREPTEDDIGYKIDYMYYDEKKKLLVISLLIYSKHPSYLVEIPELVPRGFSLVTEEGFEFFPRYTIEYTSPLKPPYFEDIRIVLFFNIDSLLSEKEGYPPKLVFRYLRVCTSINLIPYWKCAQELNRSGTEFKVRKNIPLPKKFEYANVLSLKYLKLMFPQNILIDKIGECNIDTAKFYFYISTKSLRPNIIKDLRNYKNIQFLIYDEKGRIIANDVLKPIPPANNTLYIIFEGEFKVPPEYLDGKPHVFAIIPYYNGAIYPKYFVFVLDKNTICLTHKFKLYYSSSRPLAINFTIRNTPATLYYERDSEKIFLSFKNGTSIDYPFTIVYSAVGREFEIPFKIYPVRDYPAGATVIVFGQKSRYTVTAGYGMELYMDGAVSIVKSGFNTGILMDYYLENGERFFLYRFPLPTNLPRHLYFDYYFIKNDDYGIKIYDPATLKYNFPYRFIEAYSVTGHPPLGVAYFVNRLPYPVISLKAKITKFRPKEYIDYVTEKDNREIDIGIYEVYPLKGVTKDYMWDEDSQISRIYREMYPDNSLDYISQLYVDILGDVHGKSPILFYSRSVTEELYNRYSKCGIPYYFVLPGSHEIKDAKITLYVANVTAQVYKKYYDDYCKEMPDGKKKCPYIGVVYKKELKWVKYETLGLANIKKVGEMNHGQYYVYLVRLKLPNDYLNKMIRIQLNFTLRLNVVSVKQHPITQLNIERLSTASQLIVSASGFEALNVFRSYVLASNNTYYIILRDVYSGDVVAVFTNDNSSMIFPVRFNLVENYSQMVAYVRESYIYYSVGRTRVGFYEDNKNLDFYKRLTLGKEEIIVGILDPKGLGLEEVPLLSRGGYIRVFSDRTFEVVCSPDFRLVGLRGRGVRTFD